MLYRSFLRFLPILLIALLLVYFWVNVPQWFNKGNNDPETTITNTTILDKIEHLGRLELVRYNFQEITELSEKNDAYLWLFKVPDSKAVLISQGEAVGCIDLTKMREEDIQTKGDSLIVTLPSPELCYYKLDLDKTRIYSVNKSVYYKDDKKLISSAYRAAEAQIRQSALEGGILEQTEKNAVLMLRPLFEELSGKRVYFSHENNIQYQFENR